MTPAAGAKTIAPLTNNRILRVATVALLDPADLHLGEMEIPPCEESKCEPSVPSQISQRITPAAFQR